MIIFCTCSVLLLKVSMCSFANFGTQNMYGECSESLEDSQKKYFQILHCSSLSKLVSVPYSIFSILHLHLHLHPLSFFLYTGELRDSNPRSASRWKSVTQNLPFFLTYSRYESDNFYVYFEKLRFFRKTRRDISILSHFFSPAVRPRAFCVFSGVFFWPFFKDFLIEITFF